MVSEKDLIELKRAKELLVKKSFVAELSDILGTPIEKLTNKLPKKWDKKINKITQSSLMKAVNFTVRTLDDSPRIDKSNLLHKVLVATTGAIGGATGLALLAFELPISTIIMLRSILDIARSEGEPINNIETKLACIEVFAFGDLSSNDDAAESAYFAIRSALGNSIKEATEHIAEKGLSKESAPIIVKMINKIAERFSVQVSQKVAAELVPIIGGIGGAVINTLFISHFQRVAQGHFIVKRLERKYGKDVIQDIYKKIKI